MFIMKKRVFNDYCSWLFNILEDDISNYNEKARIKGFISEILLNVYLEKQKKELNIKEISVYKQVINLSKTNNAKKNSITNQIRNNKQYRIIKFFNIEIKHKISNNVILPNFNSNYNGIPIKANNLLFAYNKHIDAKDFLDLVDNYIKYKKLQNLTNEEVLIYLHALLENNKKSQAEKILKFYIEKWGKIKLWSYFKIAQFAKEQNVSDYLIDITNKIYDKMNNDLIEFNKLIKDKNIAIVGNGPSELGSNHGKEIDNHDLVIRMNNYQIDGFEKDYGKKTDIWIRGVGSSDVIDKTKDNVYKACLWGVDYSKFQIKYPFLKILYRDINNKNLLTLSFSEEKLTAIKKESGIFFPTTGFNIISYLLKYGNHKNIDCYGMSFLQNKIDGFATHYFNDRTKKEAIDKSIPHLFHDESIYLKRIYEIEKLGNNEIIQFINGVKNNLSIHDLPNIKINIKGKNNKIIIYETIKFNNCVIDINGDNNIIEIDSTTNSINNCTLSMTPQGCNRKIKIGKNCYIGGCFILNNKSNCSITIGDNCLFSDGIQMRCDDGHIIAKKGTKEIINQGGDIVIGNHVWLGRNVFISKKSRIPDECVVGAGAIVTKKFTK